MATVKDKPSLTFHDALALGQYENALTTVADESSNKTSSRVAEIHRLPLLLRLLSASRPLSSLPDLPKESEGRKEGDEVETEEEEEEDKETTSQDTEKDVWLDDIVQRLEDRAALYSAAEGVEVLAGHLAPHVCRKWSKLPSIPRTTKSPTSPLSSSYYDTSSLEQAARSVGRRRKLSETSLGALSEDGNVLDDYNRLDAIEEEEEEDNDDVGDHRSSIKRRKTSTSSLGVIPLSSLERRQSTQASLTDRELAAEDSQQALATKSWTELALLVSQSLQTPLPTIHGDTNVRGIIPLTVDEASILAQAQPSTKGSNSESSTTGLMAADVSATLTSLLHHTPVLRYDHVAVRVVFASMSYPIMCFGPSSSS